MNYKDKIVYHNPNSEYEYENENFECSLVFEYYYEEKVVHCSNSYSYLSIPGTVFGSYDYYCSLDKYSKLTEWEIHTHEDIDFHDQQYFREEVSDYKKNGETASEQEFKKAQPQGRHIEIVPGNVVNNSDYIFYDSDRRYLERYELVGLTDEQLRIARNELYARHGYIFTTSEMIDYFNSKQWYIDIKNKISKDKFKESMFNKYEKANLELIQNEEKERKK